jgi:hypothetical protein
MTEELKKPANTWKARLRAAYAEYLDYSVLQCKFAAAALEKVGMLIPGLGPVKAMALGYLADKAGDGLHTLSNKVRGGYEIEDLPFSCRAMTEKVNRAREWLNPERMARGLGEAAKIGDAIKTLWPEAGTRIPAFAPAPG